MSHIPSRICCGLLLSGLAGAPALAEVKLPVPAVDQSAVAKRGYFYVGGKYVGEPGKEIMAGPDLCRGAGAEDAATPLPARADPWRGADRDQLDGNAGRPQGLGRVFRRAGLCRLHDRPADARALGLASGRRRDADVHREERAVPVHRDRDRRHLARAARSTRNGRAKGRTKARRAIRSSMRSMRRRSRP